MPNTILIVVTSCNSLRSGRKTGLWFDEFAIPYLIFKEKGCRITVASPKGGTAPIDPQSLSESITNNPAAKALLNHTETLCSIVEKNYDGLYIPGGNGAMYDLHKNSELAQIITRRYYANQLIASVCHGPICLTSITQHGVPLIKQRKLTCFSDAEEMQTDCADEYDFLLETRLRELGAKVTVASPWTENVVVDDKLITGQNPQSCERLAKIVVDCLHNSLP